jgi:hypothetical protein
MEGQEEVEEDKCPGCPPTSKTKENVENINEIVDLRVKWLINKPNFSHQSRYFIVTPHTFF